MAKNLMREIIKALGLEYGEVFRVSEQDAETAEDGLFYFNKEGGLIKLNPDGSTCTAWEILYDILNGWCEVVKLPWEPKFHELYFWPSAFDKVVKCDRWRGDTFDYAMKALGMIYRSREEAEANLSKDFEQLTGTKLKGRQEGGK